MNPITVVKRTATPDDDVCAECGDDVADGSDVYALDGGRAWQRAVFDALDCLNDWLHDQAFDDNEGRISKRTAENLIWQMGTRGPEERSHAPARPAAT